MYDVIVIGSGFGELSAGSLLARSWKKVLDFVDTSYRLISIESRIPEGDSWLFRNFLDMVLWLRFFWVFLDDWIWVYEHGEADLRYHILERENYLSLYLRMLYLRKEDVLYVSYGLVSGVYDLSLSDILWVTRLKFRVRMIRVHYNVWSHFVHFHWFVPWLHFLHFRFSRFLLW